MRKVSKEAFEAFDEKNFKKFDELYTKLEKADEEVAKTVLEEIKEHKYLGTSSTEKLLIEIENDVPVFRAIYSGKVVNKRGK